MHTQPQGIVLSPQPSAESFESVVILLLTILPTTSLDNLNPTTSVAISHLITTLYYDDGGAFTEGITVIVERILKLKAEIAAALAPLMLSANN